MGTRQPGYWRDLTTEDVAGLDRAKTILILPVAAMEQHGPHLPLSVDADINEGLIEATLAALPEGRSVYVLPQQTVGWSHEHGGFDGTLSIEPETLGMVWQDIADNVAAMGFRKLVIFNSHGGQTEIVKMTARKLRLSQQMLAVMVNWFTLPDVSDLFDTDELAHGIHAGAVETSLMLHLRPELVRTDRIGRFDSVGLEMARDFKRLKPTGPVSFGWETQDLNPSGAVGDAAAATADKGRIVIERTVQALIEVLDDVEKFDLARLRGRPD
jgi:creatinine amidohydrolase